MKKDNGNDGVGVSRVATTKKITITITEYLHKKARDGSIGLFGAENVSGFIGFLINGYVAPIGVVSEVVGVLRKDDEPKNTVVSQNVKKVVEKAKPSKPVSNLGYNDRMDIAKRILAGEKPPEDVSDDITDIIDEPVGDRVVLVEKSVVDDMVAENKEVPKITVEVKTEKSEEKRRMEEDRKWKEKQERLNSFKKNNGLF